MNGKRIEYFKKGVINKRWYFRIVAPNNEIIAQSEGYTSRQAMMDTLARYFPEWNVMLGRAR